MTLTKLLSKLRTPKNCSRRCRVIRARAATATAEKLEPRTLLTSFTTDVDGDGFFSPLTDGITAFRYISGQTGESLVKGSVNPNGRRSDPVDIVNFLDSPEMQRVLDLDGDGRLSALTDGVLLIRGLSGATGVDLITGAANPAGQRSTAAHIEFLIELTSSVNDNFAANEGEVLTVEAANGVLTNDPLNSVISTFDATSEEGATVEIFSDGGFTYDPKTSSTISQLTAADTVSDSFTYTIELPSGIMLPATVEISVSGRSNGGEDRLSTDDNTPIGSIYVPKGNQPSEPASLLTNDEGTGLTIVDHTSVSHLGATVIVRSDGKWNYDPTTSDLLNAMSVGQSQLDQFRYTTEDSSGQRRDVDVIVEVAGANDAPTARPIIVDTTFGDADVTISPLDFVNDAESGDTLTVTEIQKKDQAFGEATLNSDGTVTYTTSGEPQLANLRNGDVSEPQLFDYVVEDQHGAKTTGELVVFVTGGPHAPVANDDDLTHVNFSNVTPSQIGSAENVLRNDGDRDLDKLLLLVAGPVTTDQGATVTLFDDGGFVYDPTSSTILKNLTSGQTARDSFTYTITDAAGHGESTATVFFDVTDLDVNNPEVNLATAGVSSDRNRTEVSLIAGFDPSTGQANNRLYVFDEVNRTALLDLALDGVDTITIIGTAGADFIFDPLGTFPVPITILAGDGDDILVGGPNFDSLFGEGGNDVILGGSVLNSISGGTGNDEIRDQGLNILSRVAPGLVSAWQVPSLNSTPSSANLQATGDLSVTLIGIAEPALAALGTKVAVTGPSGYGFELTGQWNLTAESDGGETFTGTNVAMQTAAGAVPLGSVTLHAGPDARQISGHGPLESASGGIFSATNLLLNNPVVNEINNLTGFDFNSNLIEDQDFNFGLKLGSDLKANDLKNFNAPLNPAVPYLFATFNPEPDQVSLGGLRVAPPSQHAQFAFVMDPADPFFWINGEVSGAGGSIGWSSHGLIPFEATKQPTRVSSSDQLYGNIYGGVKFPFKKVFDLDGEVVIDYDRDYGPGSFGGSPGQTLQAQRFVDLFSGNSADWQDVVDIVTHTEIGLNGAVTFNPEIAKTDLTLSIPIAEGTLMFVNGTTVAFRGGSPDNPFGDSGSILNNVLGSLAKIDVDGHLNFANGDFRIAATASSGGIKIGPFDAASNSLAFQISNQGVDFATTISTPVGSLSFDADITFEETEEVSNHGGIRTVTVKKPGVFRFVGRAETSTLDLGVASFSASAILSLDNWATTASFTTTGGYETVISPGAVTLKIALSGSANLTFVELTASADISVSSSGSFSGSARIAANPFIGSEFSLSATVSNSGLSFSIIGIPITIPIPGFLHVESDATKSKAELVGELLMETALPGIVDEAKRRLEATGLQQDEVDLLNSTSFKISPLSDETGALGYAAAQTVTLDDNAAGYGWFIDPTPADDSEFDLFSTAYRKDRFALRSVDLLSVVMHELTHVLEFAFPDREFHFGEVGDETLRVGHRSTLPTPVTSVADQTGETDGHVQSSFTLLDSVLADLSIAGL